MDSSTDMDSATSTELETTKILRLVYTSAATSPFDEESLLALLGRARANNLRLGVTGLLLHHSGTFLQVLEGDPEVVESLYARIEEDARHDDTLVLLREEDPHRDFGDWTMGLMRATPELFSAVEGLNDFFQSREGAFAGDLEDEDRTRKILEQFRAGRWRREIEG